MAYIASTHYRVLPPASLLRQPDRGSGDRTVAVASSVGVFGRKAEEQARHALSPLSPPTGLLEGSSTAVLANSPEVDKELSARDRSPTAPENTTIIFDYDDTLLPTDWLKYRFKNPRLPKGQLRSYRQRAMASVDHNAAKLIEQALTLGSVYIITAGSKRWFEGTAPRYLPRLWHIITNRRATNGRPAVEFISARDTYGHRIRGAGEWKRLSFGRLLDESLRRSPSGSANVISVGDGEHEAKALREYAAKAAPRTVFAKRIKFSRDPGALQLAGELKTVTERLPGWVRERRSFRIEIDRRPARRGIFRGVFATFSGLYGALIAAGRCCCRSGAAVLAWLSALGSTIFVPASSLTSRRVVAGVPPR